VIRAPEEIDLAQALGLVYEALAAAIVAGLLVGIAAVWLSVAVRGGDGS